MQMLSHRNLLVWLSVALLSLSGCAPLQLIGPMAAPAFAPPASAQSLPIHNDIVEAVQPVASPGLYTMPWDATPDPDGAAIFFTAEAADGNGVFRVAAGGDVAAVATGAPFVSPRGLTISSDGQTIYVADPGANAVLVVPAAGGEVSMLAGTEGTTPRNLEIATSDGADVLYLSGVNPLDGEPAVMRIMPGEETVAVVWTGAPLVQPEGVAIAQDGTVYVADRTSPDGEWAQVQRIQNGSVETLAEGFRVGVLIGAALTPDDALLLVSALHPTEESAQVLLIELPTLQQAIFNKTIAANSGSGGVHRAHNAVVFAWADSTFGPSGSGRVYRIGGSVPSQ